MKKICLLLVGLMMVMMFGCVKKEVIIEPVETSKKEAREAFTLQPLYDRKIDLQNIQDGIYHVNFDGNSIVKEGDDIYFNITVFTEDIYDAVEVQQLQDGDTLERANQKEVLTKVVWDEQHSQVTADVDNFEDWIWCLSPSESGGTYYYHGPDDHHSYTNRGVAKVKLSKNCLLDDASQVLIGGEEKKANYDEIVNFINTDENPYFNVLNTSVEIENQEIIAINRWYIP